MLTLLLAITLTAPPVEAPAARPDVEQAAPAADLDKAIAEAEQQELQPHLVRQTVRMVLQNEATAETPAERAAAIRDLCTLYLALAADQEMAMREKLKLKAKMYSRLISIKTDLERDIARRQADQAKAEPIISPGEQENGDTPARGGGAVRDLGEELVELIEKTINPAHWDVNGGPGSIVYYPNLKVLVIRASGEAHGRVGGLLGAGRRAP